MPLCQLIDTEIQKISGYQVDPENLDPREYDMLIERLQKGVEKLETIQKILDLKSEYLALPEKLEFLTR